MIGDEGEEGSGEEDTKWKEGVDEEETEGEEGSDNTEDINKVSLPTEG